MKKTDYRKAVRILVSVLVLCLAAGMLAACGGGSGENAEPPVVTMVVKDYGTIKLELYPQYAPNTVNNFISLAKKGFYNGVIFHRVMEGFMIQGGDPDGNGTGGPGYSIKGEFAINGFEQNTLSHERGVISMARTSKNMDSAGSQFFIMHQTSKSLDGQYAAFGKVIEGMEVVDAIATCEVDDPSSMSPRPVQDVVIESVTVDTKGVNYPEPETIPEA